MHLFEYSEITVSIPSDIVDTLLEIESIHAFDELRCMRYRKELSAAVEALPGTEAGHDIALEIEEGCSTDGIMQFEEGYATALRRILSREDTPGLDEPSVLDLHRTVTHAYTRRDSRFRYRDGTEQPTAHGVLPQPVAPGYVRQSFAEMSESYGMAADVGIRPMLLVPCAVLDLMNIQPFGEANGSVSRLVTRSLLLKGGYEALRYVPFDGILAGNRDEYYESISESSSGWKDNSNDPFQFVRFMSEAVLECCREFEARYPLENGEKVGKSSRIENLLRSRCGEGLSKTDICRMLPDISRRTADKTLTDLCTEGRIEKTGTFKDARYRV